MAAADTGGETRPRVSFDVAGIPAGKGSRTVGTRRDGSHYTRPGTTGEKEWAEIVAYSARANRPSADPLTPPYAVELRFWLPEPERPSWSWPSRIDVDKLARNCLDALVIGGLLLDDRHVVWLSVSKAYGTPGVRVSVA